jgi:uncharacterized protein YkwD
MLAKALLSAAAIGVFAAAPGYAMPPQVPVAGIVKPVPGHPEAVPAAMLMSQVATKTNVVRQQFGCDALAIDHELIDASVRQSLDMAATGRFSHIGNDGSTFAVRAHAAGYAKPSGENIAWGYGTADQVMTAWMASPHHRANILNCAARSIGTGVVYAQDGTPYYTEVFGFQ